VGQPEKAKLPETAAAFLQWIERQTFFIAEKERKGMDVAAERAAFQLEMNSLLKKFGLDGMSLTVKRSDDGKSTIISFSPKTEAEKPEGKRKKG